MRTGPPPSPMRTSPGHAQAASHAAQQTSPRGTAHHHDRLALPAHQKNGAAQAKRAQSTGFLPPRACQRCPPLPAGQRPRPADQAAAGPAAAPASISAQPRMAQPTALPPTAKVPATPRNLPPPRHCQKDSAVWAGTCEDGGFGRPRKGAEPKDQAPHACAAAWGHGQAMGAAHRFGAPNANANVNVNVNVSRQPACRGPLPPAAAWARAGRSLFSAAAQAGPDAMSGAMSGALGRAMPTLGRAC